MSSKKALTGKHNYAEFKEVYGEDVKFRWNVMTYKYTLV